MNKFILLVLLVASISAKSISIEDFGAVPDINNPSIAYKNQDAIQNALYLVSHNDSYTNLIVPNKTYYTFPVNVTDGKNFQIDLDGTLFAYDSIPLWPNTTDGKRQMFIHFENCDNVKIIGYGMIEAQGWPWWEAMLLNLFPDHRPHLMTMSGSTNFEMRNFRMKNSPQFHIFFSNCANFIFDNLDIRVNTEMQKELHMKYGNLLPNGIPLFPLNTDGIDPNGKNITITNTYIENFDDAVAVKPGHSSDLISGGCAQDMYIANMTIHESVGMTIGSVPPSTGHACINNITFKNVTMFKPIKSIYIKTNPGTNGDGSISNILYEDFVIHEPIWWNIYIGPQQQDQPGGGQKGLGCMIYPLEPCETQPRVPITNVTLRNIQTKDVVLTPGIIRCNETNPCHGFVFDNVNIEGWKKELEYITENVYGEVIISQPAPHFMKELEQVQQIK